MADLAGIAMIILGIIVFANVWNNEKFQKLKELISNKLNSMKIKHEKKKKPDWMV